MRLIYSIHSLLLVLIMTSFFACADIIEQDDNLVTQLSAGEPGMSYEWPSDSNTAGNQFTEIIAEDPMGGELMGGESVGGVLTGGELVAGEPMIDIMMAGDSGSTYPSYAIEMLEYVNQFRQTVVAAVIKIYLVLLL